MHVFSANGAAFTASLGKRPRINGTKTATALKARLNFLQKFLKNIRAIEARFQRLLTWRSEFLGRRPRLA
jgi:hypothetical protein